jgi:phosphoglycerate dehydrogenase-like enzyme
MPSKPERFRIAVLDDYQNVALSLADWSALDERATVTVFNDHLADSDAVVERLQPFDIVCVMRERTPITGAIIERLPNLRLIASTAMRNASIDLKAAEERGVQVVHTGYTSAPTIELTWALILASARNLVAENASLRRGGWQQSVGDDMSGRTLGLLGLGNVGGAVARIGNAFGMKVIAWSQNLTTERTSEVGAALVSKDDLFQEADVVSIHLVLSGRTRGLVGAAELGFMKPTARLINTSRGPIVVEADLVAALKDKKIAGAAIDVFDQEPLPLDHPLRALPNLLATPHIGYVSRGLYERFYQDTVANIRNWLDSIAEGSRAPRVATRRSAFGLWASPNSAKQPTVSRETVNDSTPQTGPHGQHCVFPLISGRPFRAKTGRSLQDSFPPSRPETTANVDSPRRLKRLKRANSGY